MDRWPPFLYVAPAVLVLAAVMGFPIIQGVVMSFQQFTLNELVSGDAPFVGLDNYARAFADPTFPVALVNSLVFTVVSITFQFTIGFALALLFSSRFPLSNTFRGLMLVGWQIPVVVTGTLFLWMFNLDYGLGELHPPEPCMSSREPIGWTVDAGAALPAVIIANVWLGSPIQPDHVERGDRGPSGGHLRGRHGRRRERLAEDPPHHDPAASSRDPGRVDARFHLHAAGLRPDLDHDQGRAQARDRGPCPPSPTASHSCTSTSAQSSAVAVIVLVILLAAASSYLRSAFSDES